MPSLTEIEAAPRSVTCREDTLLEETLYKEDLLPVCSPALLAALGRPDGPAGLDGWPLLYDLRWDADWSYWFARQGEPTPDLSRASGFRLYSMLIQAAVHGIGAAIGRPMLIARELESRTLVRVFDQQMKAPERCCLITTAASRQRPQVQAFRKWEPRDELPTPARRAARRRGRPRPERRPLSRSGSAGRRTKRRRGRTATPSGRVPARQGDSQTRRQQKTDHGRGPNGARMD